MRSNSDIAKIVLLLAAGFILGHTPASGQEHSYSHYDVHDGLAGSTVYSMVQDEDGFMWFATESGLSRFDGTRFRNFTTNDGLPDNEILKLFKDSRNRIWIIPFKKSIVWYEKGQFHTAQNDSLLARIPVRTSITGFVEDKHGNILLIEKAIAHFIDPAGSVTEIELDKTKEFPGQAWKTFIQCGLDEQGELLVCLFHHVVNGNIYKGDGLTVNHVVNGKLVPEKLVPGTYVNSTLSVCLDRNLQAFLLNGPILQYQWRNIVSRVPAPQGLIGITRCNDSTISMNTNYGAFLLNLRQGKLSDTLLPGKAVNSMLEDSEGNWWLSTLGKGVFRMGSPEVRNYPLKEGGNNLAIFSFQKIDSALYFGGDHFHLGRLDLASGKVESRKVYDAVTRGRIMAIQQMEGRKLVLGTDLGNLELDGFQRGQGILRDFGSTKAIQIMDDSLLLISANLSISIRSRRDLSAKTIRVLISERGTTAYHARSGTYYYGTLDGLGKIEKDMRPVPMSGLDKAFRNRIVGIGETPDSTIWIATDGGGLLGYRDGRITARITMKEGMTSNICKSLFIGSDAIWVGTDRGLNKVRTGEDGPRIIPYTISDGLSSDMINTVWVDGDVVFTGGPEGMTMFNESRISRRSGSILRITGITVSGNPMPYDTSGFTLPHKDNNIRFDYVGISFKSTGSILYKYRLLGLDSVWKTTTETALSYPSLPSGDYELQLTAMNKFGVVSRQASIRFTIDKLLWERWWFRLPLLLLLAGLIFTVFVLRVRRIRRKEAQKADLATRMAELEQMALRSQMNPHFIFNCLNSIQQYVIYQDVLGANEFISRFSFLIRQTLNFSTRTSITIEEELNYLTAYLELEKKRFENKFIYEIVVPDNVDRYQYRIPPMILQPYIENAIRHGIGLRSDNKGKIQVRMEKRDGYLECIVEDNGVGRKYAAKFKSANSIAYQSVGMSLVAKRVEMLNRSGKAPVLITVTDLENASGSGIGTRIILRFPLESFPD